MAGNPIYVTAAFKTTTQNQAYFFMEKEYVLDDYAPGSPNDKILVGPAYIRDDFPSLKNTVFGQQGINCAFASQDNGIAFIFSGNICAKWLYPRDEIVSGPMPIAQMFPFFKGTVFENGVDAAFESTRSFEAYLFRGDQYARINYSSCPQLMTIAPIHQGWPCLKGTVFEYGFDAAFASHISNQAYLFKEDYYARIQFTPGATDDKILNSGNIRGGWPNLGAILPRYNQNMNKLVAN